MANGQAHGTHRVPAGITLLAALVTFGTTAALVTAGGCGGSSNGPNGSTPATPSPTPGTGWAVFAYMPARNAQAQAAEAALQNLTSLPPGKTSTVPVVAETAYSTLNDGTAPFLSTKRVFGLNGSLTQLADSGNQSMVDGNDLASFITAASAQVPTVASRCLILMAPGGLPFLGVGADTGTATLDLAGLDAALTSGLTNAGLTKFDLVILDVPQSATAEMLSVMKKHASFVVAVESGASTAGFDSLGLANALANGATPAPSALAQTVLQGYVSNTQSRARDQVGELIDSQFDLSQAGTITDAINTFAGALVADIGTAVGTLPEVLAAIGSCRAAAVEIDVHAQTNQVDVGSFAANIAAVNTATAVLSPTVISAASALVNTLGTNVTTGNVGAFYGGAKGLSVYFPHDARQNNSGYTTSAAAFANDAPNWAAFLTSYLSATTTNAVAPSILSLTAPFTVAQSSRYTVSATIFPNNMIHNVTLLVVQQQNGQNVVLSRTDLGAPDAQTGNISASPFMIFCAANAGSDGPFLFPLNRNTTTAQGQYFAVDCDQTYTTSAGSTTLSGYMKTSSIAGVGSAVAWQPFESNGALGRNDFALISAPGVTYTLFPRVITVDSTGKITATSQKTDALRSTTASIHVDPTQLLNQTTPVAAQIWIVAETFNGDTAASSVSITIQ